MPLIVARGLTRIYSMGSSQVVGVREVDLEVEAGDFVVLKGDSGSGKTTLLSLLGGLDRPTRGELRVAGHDLHQADPARLTRYRRHVVGMVFQSFNLLPTLSVLENVCLPALLAGSPYSSTRREAAKLLHQFGLEHRLDHWPSQLSGGEMQRAAIARSLVNNPAILLADEPTGNLDSRNGRMVVDLLARLNREESRTVVMATHSHLADHCATLQVLLEDGARIDGRE